MLHTKPTAFRGRVVVAGVLDTPVRVMEQSSGALGVAQCGLQGGEPQADMQSRITRPADDAPAPNIEPGGEIKPTFRRFDVDEVGP